MLHPLELRFIGVAPPGSATVAIAQWLLANRAVSNLLIIDDVPMKFEVGEGAEVIHCDPSSGISAPDVQVALLDWLRRTALLT